MDNPREQTQKYAYEIRILLNIAHATCRYVDMQPEIRLPVHIYLLETSMHSTL